MKMNEWKPIVTLIVVIFFGVVTYMSSSKEATTVPVATPVTHGAP